MFPLRILPLFLALFSSTTQAAAPSGETWFTLQTKNFRIHHTKPLEPYARKFGSSLERALPLLEKDLRWQMPSPIDIVVMDPSDSANGFAANFPNTRIEVYAVPFETDSALGHYVDWVEELATHELTHIIANDTTLSYYKFLRSVFGSWVRPNGLQPSWLIEGLAVYEETRHTKGGRGRSPLLEALFRQAASEKKLNSPDYLSIDRFNDGAPWWPGGNTAYLLGYAIQAYADRLTGKELDPFPGAVSEANAQRLPFMPDKNVSSLAGKEWSEIWGESAAFLAERYKNDSTSATPCWLTNSGRFTGGHAVSTDGWIYFSQEDQLDGYYLSRARVDAPCSGAEIEKLVSRRFDSPTGVAVSPNGKIVAYVESDYSGGERFHGDLYLFDVSEKESRALKNAGRSHDPAFLSDSKLLYVKNLGDSRQAIVKRDLANDQEETLFTGKHFERISGLTAADFGPERFAFALHDNKGNEVITVYDGKFWALPAPEGKSFPRYERNPWFTGDGSLIFAASYAGSPQDLYSYNPTTKKRTRLYRAASGYVDRPVLRDRVFFIQEYGIGGLNISRIDANIAPAKLAEQKENLHEYLTGDKTEYTVAEEKELPPSQPYDPWNTTATSPLPQYWIPEINAAENGALLGVSTGGQDALGYHQYGGVVQYDTRAKFPIYRLFYVNRQNTTSFTFQAAQVNDYFRSSKSSSRKNSYSAAATIPFGDFSFSFGPSFQEQHVFSTKGQSFTFFHNLRYDRISQKPSALSPNRGAFFNAYLGLVPSSRNEDFFVDTRPAAAVYFQGFSPADSVSFSANAGISTNRYLASNYYLGGGVSTLSPSDFVVRGYPVDALLGNRMATFNAAYTLLVARPYRGWGTNPLFLRTFGFRFHGDVGSANFVSRYANKTFLGYQRQSLGQQNLVGTGVDLVATGSFAYHVPLSAELGVHYGLLKKFGGEALIHFGLNVGAFGNIGSNDGAARGRTAGL